jgi:hypothetical protein
LARRALLLSLGLLGALALGVVLGLAARDETAPPRAGTEEEAPWRLATAMSSRRSYVAADAVGDSIYVAGGMVGETGRPLDTFQRYDAPDDRWTTLQRLPAPTRAAAGAAVGGTLYVVGGTTPEGNTQTVWAYDVGEGTWSERAPLPVERFNHAALALGNEVWIFGGYMEGQEHDEVFVYDTAADSWREGPRLPRPAHGFDVVEFRGEVWLIGGLRGEEILDEVWILDPESEEWREGPPLEEPMELLGAAVHGDEIHAVWEHVYQVYDDRTGEWRLGPRPIVTRHALSVFVVAGHVYTVGGCTTALVDSPVVERRPLAPAS